MRQAVTILNDEGMHARPAALFVKAATNFKSDINIIFGEKIANAKSIMSLMTLGLVKDTEIIISAVGIDEQTAIDSLTDLVKNKFNLH
ncbi:MAG: HPr family phosphocarrier protein [Bacteriovoracaceae bacterium]|jgi:phosphocarrier protein HPr|nr:HPr family phosphocarrier protein [Bacteriovoracaceae bacterium]